MTYSELKRKLRRLEARHTKEAKKHEVWSIPTTSRQTLIPRHRGEVPTGTLHRILRDLGLTMEDLERV